MTALCRLHVVCRPADSDAATRVVAALQEQVRVMRGALAMVGPPIDFASIPSLPDPANPEETAALGLMDLVLVILPDGEFTPDERSRLAPYVDQDRTRLIPVSPAAERDVPHAPLQQIVSFRLHGGGDGGDAPERVLVRHTLNLAALRVASADRQVFLSYTVRDGKPLAEALTKKLESRGFSVWRDMERDPDGVEQIRPGSKAQATIEQAIVDRGCVLLLDTPQAKDREWVRAEVGIAIAELLPILPVVVEPNGGTSPPRGGRFLDLRDLQRDVRLPCTEVEQAVGGLTDAFVDRLEHALFDVMLSNLRTQWRLVPATEGVFDRASFVWRDTARRLVFTADKQPDGRFDGPTKFLVQCSPYERLVRRHVKNLERIRQRDYGSVTKSFLVHSDEHLGSVDADEISTAHVAVATPDELEDHFLGGPR